MRTSTMIRGWVLSVVLYGLGCTAGSDGRQTSADPTETISGALTGPIQNDFEDGTTQGWIPFGSPYAHEHHRAGVHRHAQPEDHRPHRRLHGPQPEPDRPADGGRDLPASRVAVRLVAGEAPTTIRVTMQRTLSGGTQAFDTIAQNTNVTDDAWVTMTGNYSFTRPTSPA